MAEVPCLAFMSSFFSPNSNLEEVPGVDYYPPEAAAFLAEFPQPLVTPARTSPREGPAVQYRDPYTGDLLAIHPYVESPEYQPDGSNNDATYGPGTLGEDLYFAGWFSGSVWHVKSDGTTVWRKGGFKQAPLADNDPYGSWQTQPLAVADGVWIQLSDPIELRQHVVKLDALTGDIVTDLTLAPSFYLDGTSLWTPDNQILVSQGYTTPKGIHKINPLTGDVTLWKSMDSLGLAVPYTDSMRMAAHPGGDGFAVSVWKGSPDTTAIVEIAWDGTVGDVYTAGGGIGTSSVTFIYAISYSPDGNYLYGIRDFGTVVHRWERGPGNVGGTEPWLGLDYITRDAWIADGSSATGENNAPWFTTSGGMAIATIAEPCSPPANDALVDAINLPGTTGAMDGTTICATMEAGEPAADVAYVDGFGFDAEGSHSVWYTWTPPNDYGGAVAFNASPGGTDIIIDVFTGSTVSDLTPVGADQGYVEIAIPPGPAPTYRVRVNPHYAPDELDFNLQWFSASDPPPSCPDNTVWYAYTPTRSGEVTFFIDADGLSVSMDVFTGNNLTNLVGPVDSYAGVDPLLPMTFPVAGFTTYWIRVYNDTEGESGPFTLSWAFRATPQPARSTLSNRGRLGCGELGAFITARCGAPRLCQLTDASQITWNRRLDDISEAQVVVPVGGSTDSECCECLASIEPWCHELHIFRNGVFVWGGPVVAVQYGYESVTIDARDLLAWTQYRIPEININYQTVGADISVIGETVLRLAFADDDPCAAEYIQTFPTEFPNTILEVMRCFEGTAFDQLATLSEQGLDYTVLGRSIILGGSSLPTRAIGVLTDEMIMGDVKVTKNGFLAANRYYVTYLDYDDPAQCTAQGVDIECGADCPCSCPAASDPLDEECYGTLEKLHDLGEAGDYATAKVLANSLAAGTRLVPRTIEFSSGTRISPETPWDINDMVPGQRVDVMLTGLCLPIRQSFRILEMSSSQEGLNEEEVALTLGTIATDTGEI